MIALSSICKCFLNSNCYVPQMSALVEHRDHLTVSNRVVIVSVLV